MIDVSQKLKNLRIKNNFTQEQIAEICNVSRQAVAKWESGINYPDLEKLLLLSKIFHVTIDELVNESSSINDLRNIYEQKNYFYENDRIINKALEKAMICKDTSEGINQFISFVGEQFGLDRICIFEVIDEYFKNTYEWCKKGSPSQMEYLQHIPLKDMSSWLNAFSTNGYVFIKDIDEINSLQPVIYKWLKPQGIKSVLVYPIFGGRGFISVDNPAPAFVLQICSLLEIMTRFIEIMLQQRNLLKEWKWVVLQNDNFSSYNKAVVYHIDIVTGQIQYNIEQAHKAGYTFNLNTITELKKLCSEHPEFYDHALIDGFDKVLKTKENYSIEFISFRDDKKLRWNKISVSPFIDNNGNVLQLYGMLQDISESHRIIEQYNKYILNLEGGIHIFYLSRPIHLEYASDNLSDFLGYTHEEFEQIVGTKYTNIILEEDRSAFIEYAKKLSTAPGIESCKYRLVKKDGSIITVIDTMESILDSSGVMYGYAYVIPELQIHVMLDKVRENEKRHTELMNQTTELLEVFEKDYLNIFIVWLDEDKTQLIRRNGYIIKDFEKETYEFYPYNKLCNQYIQERVHPDDKEKMIKAMHPDNVRKAFEKSDEYIVKYRTFINEEIHHFEFKYIRLQKTKDNSNIIFVASFKSIDDENK